MIRYYILFLLVLVMPLSLCGQAKNGLASFRAEYTDNDLVISWVIIDPENVSRFLVEKRKSSQESFAKICEVPFSNFRKKTDNDSVVSYSYVCDDSPEDNGVYYYSLSILDASGKIIDSPNIIKVGISEVPEFRLKQNNPNPFNPSTVIQYEVLVPSRIKISVFTLTGQLVDVLVDEFHAQGNYSVNFNTSNYSDLSSGIYFYKLESDYSSDIRKMIFAK